MSKHWALDAALNGRRPSWRELLPLTEATGADLHALCATADALRAQQAGDAVTYVLNRNINFTNVCVKKCGFCAFSRTGRSEEGYFLDTEEIVRRVVEARALGATEVCIQAGLAPGLDGMFYVELTRAVKRAVPEIHLHAFSPEEVKYGAHRARLPVREYLAALREAGLGTLPGTSAEILDDTVRDKLAPGRITSAEWLDVVRTAHELGLRTTATMMYGHLESPADRLRHMETIRDLQRETGGFTEFVPLSFVHDEAPLFAAQPGVRPGPGGLDVVRTHALARVVLGADLPNLQVSWVKEGMRVAEHLLACGVNDLGGTLMNESISTSAGARHGQFATPAELRRVAHNAGRVAVERTTLYRIIDAAAAGSRDREVDALDGIGDAASTFGTYAALTRDERFRFRRRRGGEQLVEVGGRVEIEGEAVGPYHGDAQAGSGGADQVTREAVAVAEASGQRGGQAQREGVGAELIAIRRKHQVRAV
ncbi:MAG TPA: 5-amino-6-(D-ribitylamino)uracil--L-tyrosine 4-hydroxyphenyl transferase CofH [Kofleriaceae bacterium]|nr:5-amino-6-(D-ribitylamino)uracil--L-tyrosine 4-hydroxyphenyl transferase CofH [Kofleriaceae bacterium]